MAGRRARADLHQLRRGAPLCRAGAPLAASRPAHRRARLSAGALHAGGPRQRRFDRRGQAGARTLNRPGWRVLGRRFAARRWPLLLLVVAGTMLTSGRPARAVPPPERAQPAPERGSAVARMAVTVSGTCPDEEAISKAIASIVPADDLDRL